MINHLAWVTRVLKGTDLDVRYVIGRDGHPDQSQASNLGQEIVRHVRTTCHV